MKKNNIMDIFSGFTEADEEMFLSEATKKTIRTERAKSQITALYQHTAKFIIDPSKRTTKWATTIDSTYNLALKEINKIADNTSGKKFDKALSNIDSTYKEEIIKDGAKQAEDELDKKHDINTEDFYKGKVPEMFDIKTIFKDKNKFIDDVVKLTREYEKKDSRRSRDSEDAIKVLIDHKEE